MNHLADARLDSERGAWLTAAEAAIHDQFQAMALGEIIDIRDMVVLLGAAGGGIAASLRHCVPAHLMLVESDRANRRLLDMSWNGARGVSIVDADPVEKMREIFLHQHPSVAVLNFPDRLTEVEVVTTLSQPNEGLEVLIVVYPVTPTEQHEGLDEMLRTWHDDERLRWYVRDHDGPPNAEIYVREGEPE